MLIFLILRGKNSEMIACICGGFLEIGYILVTAILAILGTMTGTNWYNKIRYRKYIEYKNKHKGCHCDCHKDDKDE